MYFDAGGSMPRSGGDGRPQRPNNVLGGLLEDCSLDPLTGFYRDGCCNTGRQDHGLHMVCAVMTADFLEFSKGRGNDLSTPMPQYNFPGLNPGDQWCLCALRWVEAYKNDKAPLIVLKATHEYMLQVVPLDVLKQFAVDLPDTEGQ